MGSPPSVNVQVPFELERPRCLSTAGFTPEGVGLDTRKERELKVQKSVEESQTGFSSLNDTWSSGSRHNGGVGYNSLL